MWQYAFCTALNEKGKRARLSFSTFLYYYHHNGFDLARAFKLKLPFPYNLLSFFLLKCGAIYKNKFFSGFFRRFIQWYYSKVYTIYNEKEEFKFDSDVFLQETVFFKGTWQAERYFKDIKEKFLQPFVFKSPIDSNNKTIIEKISTHNAVSVHIRRGDYLSSHWGKRLFVIKDISYYKRAIEYIRQNVNDPHYFFFSDDMQWIKENFQMPNCTYVDHNKGKKSYIDMYLMSLCKHNIIANSSFSWWGAWLNKNGNKIVVMPEKWMNDNSCTGIFPDEWIKMKV
jgi:hypothetical protein